MEKKRKFGITLPLMGAAVLCCILALSRLEQERQAEGMQQLEEALRRTAVTCYASEGFYPPDVSYMQRRYGLTYDEESYTVYYEVYASNLMPDITVLEK